MRKRRWSRAQVWQAVPDGSYIEPTASGLASMGVAVATKLSTFGGGCGYD